MSSAARNASGPAPHRVFVFPYLTSRYRAAIGPFELIPWADLPDVEVAEPWLRERLHGFERMYDSQVVFAQYLGQPLGVAPPDELLGPLRRAVFVATISDSSPLDDGEAAGWGAVTADNALAHIHPIPEHGEIAVAVGRILRTTLAGAVESRRGGIPKPVEMPDPLAPPVPDSDIGDAVYLALVESTEAARRLALAIDWLDVAWRNTESIRDDVRVLSVFAGFEVLLMEGVRAESRKMAKRYDAFLGESVKTTRRWTKPSGSPTSGEFSDFGWWLLRFALLRNKLAHGEAVGDADYVHEDGRHHFAIGEQRLRDAILRVAQEITGVEDLLLTPFDRAIHREWAKQLHESAEATREDDSGEREPPRPRHLGRQ